MAYGRLLERAGRFRGEINTLQLRIIAYIARCDEVASERRREDQLKDNLLVFNPDLYSHIYDDEGNIKVAEDDIDWKVPNSEADVQRMLQDMKRLGIAV